MDLEKQKLVLSIVAENKEVLAMVHGIIQPSYFDPTLKKTVKFIKEYFDKYKDIPKLATIKAETGCVLENVGKLEKADQQYVTDELEIFCKEQAVLEVIINAPELIEKDMSKIMSQLKDALSIGIHKDIGLDYFKNPEARIRSTSENINLIPTGIEDVDNAIGGGIGRGELLLVTASSNGGKSMTMLDIGDNMLAQGYNGVYVSLEMGENIVGKRLDTMISHVPAEDILNNINKVVTAIEKASNKYGRFLVKRMPEMRTNVNDIAAWLKQLEQNEGFIPDFIIVDYVDIMGTTQKSIDLNNLFLKDKAVTEELRGLAFDFDAAMLSASQLGKHAGEDGKPLSQGDIQGGSSKINTTDYAIAIRQDDLMRSNGEIWFDILKSRNANSKGKKILLRWNPISLKVSSLQNDKDGLVLVKKQKDVVLSGGDTLNKSKGNAHNILNLMQ